MKLAILAALALSAFATVGHSETLLSVSHGPVSDPVYIDLGAAGDSVGDQRIFELSGKTADEKEVFLEFIMTTMGSDEQNGTERRVTLGILTLGAGIDDQILIQGVGLYPRSGSTVKMDATLQRAVIGGTGRYAGARGVMTSTHLPDGTWRHDLAID